MKLLKITIFFFIFDQNRTIIWLPLNLASLASIAINFHSGGFMTATFCFKWYSLSKMWKKPNDKTTGFQLDMLGNSINIKNFIWNQVVLKKNLQKPLKITIIWPNLCKKGVPMGHNLFSEIIKPDHKLSKTFNLNKMSYALAELWMFFYFMFFFFAKKCQNFLFWYWMMK